MAVLVCMCLSWGSGPQPQVQWDIDCFCSIYLGLHPSGPRMLYLRISRSLSTSSVLLHSLFLQPLVCLNLFVPFLSYVAVSWDCYIYHHCPLLLPVNRHSVWLVTQQLLVSIDGYVSQSTLACAGPSLGHRPALQPMLLLPWPEFL